MLTAFQHHARSYFGPQDFPAVCAEAVRSGLGREERPMVLAGSDCLDDVRQALGELGTSVTLVPIDDHTRNPSRLVTMLHTYGNRASSERFLGVCQIGIRGRSPAQLDEVHLAECMLNTAAFEQLPLSVVCLYDDHDLDPAARTKLRCSHPKVAGVDPNPDFDAALATELHAAPLDPPPASAQEHTVQLAGLASLRSSVKAFAAAHGIAPDRCDDLVLATNEIVTNSVRYGGGRAVVQVWAEGASVVLQSRDRGYIRNLMVGRLAPRPEATSGRGLWLAHHLCDLVQLRSAESTGTTVRLFVDR